jgi:hypothetical protein
MKRLYSILLCCCAVFVLACNSEKEDTAAAEATNENSEVFQTPFSSTVTLVRAKKYADASVALMKLGEQWSERLGTASEAEMPQVIQAYERAREQLVKEMGLAGMVEYLWIQNVALTDTTNRLVFKQTGVQIP